MSDESGRVTKREIGGELVRLITPDAAGNIPVITEMGLSHDQYKSLREAILGRPGDPPS